MTPSDVLRGGAIWSRTSPVPRHQQRIRMPHCPSTFRIMSGRQLMVNPYHRAAYLSLMLVILTSRFNAFFWTRHSLRAARISTNVSTLETQVRNASHAIGRRTENGESVMKRIYERVYKKPKGTKNAQRGNILWGGGEHLHNQADQKGGDALDAHQDLPYGFT